MRARTLLLAVGGALIGACSGQTDRPDQSAPATVTPATVGYDVRRLRPPQDRTLEQIFARMQTQAQRDGKQIAVLFSAQWCERCRALELELGSLHPPQDIEHIRILELVEEDWEQALRMNEFDALRQRWDPVVNTYPLLVVLDDHGQKVEEMKEAVERLEQANEPTTLSHWFRGLRQSRPPTGGA